MDDGGGGVKARYVSFNSLRMGNWFDVVLFWFTVVDYIAKNEQGLVRLFYFRYIGNWHDDVFI